MPHPDRHPYEILLIAGRGCLTRSDGRWVRTSWHTDDRPLGPELETAVAEATSQARGLIGPDTGEITAEGGKLLDDLSRVFFEDNNL